MILAIKQARFELTVPPVSSIKKELLLTHKKTTGPV